MELAKHKNGKVSLHKIGLYIRVSTEEQAENPEGSIKNQEDRLRSAVQFKNISGPFGDITHVFVDRARSGKDTNRPELQRLLSAIRKREVTLVMVSELSRLSRSIKDFSQIWEMMQTHGCSFYSLRENFDTTTAAGEMMLYTIANFAQFERRQTSERISANFQARAARGLYNGGVIPLGYKLIEDKPGFLDIDADAAETVKKSFETFLKEGTLSQTAKWLNANGYKVKREVQGGNHRPRLGHFTIENLHQILRNKSYIGVRTYTHKNEKKEAKATWKAIIDKGLFHQVQAQLAANYCRKKPPGGNRYPFLLTGPVNCECCGERMVGKSAHGNGGKIPYYEHSWATRRQSCLVKPVYSCRPFRVLAKKLEPAIWDAVMGMLQNQFMAEDLIENAQKLHKEKGKNTEAKRIVNKIKSIESQIEVLAERLAILPKSISPATIFKQMEKLEISKKAEEVRLAKEGLDRAHNNIPATLKQYQEFLRGLSQLASENESHQMKERIIRALIRKVWITENGFKLEFITGGDYIEMEQRSLEPEPDFSGIIDNDSEPTWDVEDIDLPNSGQKKSRELIQFPGSNTLTNGGIDLFG